MSITFHCPNPACKKRMTVKDEFAGKKGVCAACKQRLVVPAANGVAAPAPAAKAPSPAAPAKARAAPVDVEAEAAAFFSEGPTEAPAPASETSPAPRQTPKPAKPSTPPPPKVESPRDAAAPPTPPAAQGTAAKVPAATADGHVPPAPGDMEAEAAAFFADEPKKNEDTPKSIKFNCEYCDHPLELGVEMANKRTPCPECRRIIKVPDIVKPVKKDWLKGAQPEAAPVGAAGSGKGATMVSEEALEAAGAIPDEPLTRGQKLVRYAGVACVLLLAGWGVWAIIGWWGGRKEKKAVDELLEYAKSPAAVKASGYEGAASLHIAAGQYFLLTRAEGCAEKARDQFRQALADLGQAPNTSPERDAVLMDLALAQVDLGGSEKEVEKGQRLKWDELHKPLRATLEAIQNEDGRLTALRAASRKLIDRDQGQHALDLASQVFAQGQRIPRTEAVATIGLELYTAGKRELAKQAAEKALTAETEPPPQAIEDPEAPARAPPANTRLTPAVKALAILTDGEPKGFDEPDSSNAAMGQAEAAARQGEWDNAHNYVAKVNDPNLQVRARITLASVGPQGKDDLDTALKAAVQAQDLPPWWLLELVDLGGRAGTPEDRLQAVANRISDSSLRGRGQLLVFRAKLARSKAAGDEKDIELIDKTALLSARLAKLALARHNTRLDSGFLKTVQTWDEAAKAFGLAGALQGLHGAEDEEMK
jgi:hypothetical protein